MCRINATLIIMVFDSAQIESMSFGGSLPGDVVFYGESETTWMILKNILN